MQQKSHTSSRHSESRSHDASLWRERIALLFDKILPLYTVLLILWVIAFIEWTWSWQLTQLNPLYTTLIAGVMSVYVILRSWPVWRHLAESDLEPLDVRAVGAYLDRLRGLGYRVCHDVPADSGNIDHVVLCPHGVFCISTINRSRPVAGECSIRFDGHGISVNGNPVDTSPVAAARARAAQLRRILREHTGDDLPVRAVLLYPGWHVETPDAGSLEDVWVLAPRALPMWIRHADEVLHPRDAKHAAGRLAVYLRRYA